MNILTVIIIAVFGISFVFSAVILAACAVSSNTNPIDVWSEEYYELDIDSFDFNGSNWVPEG